MRILVAGATGALGVPLTRALLARGHEVIGLTRSARKRGALHALGASAVVADALDAPALGRAVAEAQPEAVVHALTALPKDGPARRAHFTETNRLRITGTGNLLTAAIRAGARRLVAESMIFAYGFGDLGTEPLTEEHPFEPVHSPVARVAEAIRSLEHQVLDASATGQIEGIVLRYGMFYGPDAASTQAMTRLLRRRRFPLLDAGQGIASWIRVEDAVSATIAALQRGRPGTAYSVVDDQPVQLGEFIGEWARVVGAPPPIALPGWVSRMVLPTASRMLGARVPVSNAKIKRELGWQPSYPTYRVGLHDLAERNVPTAAQKAPDSSTKG